jgi:hypothetical protein
MSETNVCIKYGRSPRHECTLEWCEFDDLETLRAERNIWKALGNTFHTEYAEKKLQFALDKHPEASV